MKSLNENIKTRNSGNFYLEPDSEKLAAYLKHQGWLETDDSIVMVEKPGEGNMNFVLRIIPAKAESFIVKQARPWVEKYPDLKAPVERIHVEYEFYRYINQYLKLFKYSPAIVGFDRVNNVLVLEDLGQTVDFSFVYQKKVGFNYQDLSDAIEYLNCLKQLPAPNNYPSNLALRKLNHQHIFELPFGENDFNLDQIHPGLQQVANLCKQDTLLVREIHRLGDLYLGNGALLLHGDFYPGSMLKSSKGLKIIDPEFSFVGPEEWDIAVFVAHLFLSQTAPENIRAVMKLYQPSATFDEHRFAGFTGTEIMRRLIGLAQVPVELTLDQKAKLIQKAVNWIKTGKIDTLSGFD